MIPLNRKYLCMAMTVLALFFCLSGCKDDSPKMAIPTVHPELDVAETTEATTDPMELVEELAVVMAEGEIYKLSSYPNLKSVDFSGSTCYAAIIKYAQNHPHIAVTYTVDLGGIWISEKETAITLEPGAFDYALLTENLKYLPNLRSISLPDIILNAQQISELTAAYPDVALEYTVNVLGKSYDLSTTELDLSGMSPAQAEDAAAQLGLLTNLKTVTLSNSLSMTDVAMLQDSNPGATFHYSFTLFGKSLSTTTESVEYKNQNIGNEGENEIRLALAILDNCSRFVLDNCGLDYEVLAAIREDFRDGPKVVWRIYFGVGNRYTTLTDDDTILAVKNVTDETCGPMKYLEDVKYMDIGHNPYLTDLSFVGNMPELEILIASESAVTDISGLANCKKLTWLELAYCYSLKDIDALAQCESLKYLNLSYSKVTNLMPLDGLALERFVYLSPKASVEEQNTFIAIHPKSECITVFYGYSMPYSYGWRYNDNGKTFFSYYKDVVRVVFGYDEIDAQVKAQEEAAGK